MKKYLANLLVIASLIVSASIQADITSDLFLHYTFDNVVDGIVPDVSGNKLDGVLKGSSSTGPGYDSTGASIILTNDSDYVQLPNDITSTLTDYTVACWVKLTAITYWGRIFDFGNGTSTNMFLCPYNGKPYFSIKQNDATGEISINSKSALQADRWVHIAITYDFNELTGIGDLTMYLNGVQVISRQNVNITPKMMGNTTQNYIGKSQYAKDPGLNGSVDDFRIYSRALSMEEVMTLKGVPAPLIKEYNLLNIATDLKAISGNLILPTPLDNNVIVTWTTSDSTLVTEKGVVTRPLRYAASAQLNAKLSMVVDSVTSVLDKSFDLIVLPLQSSGDTIAIWNFPNEKINRAQDGTVTVQDESLNGFVATCVGGAQIVSIGSTQSFNVLSIKNEGEYFDFGTAIGEAIYSLNDYTVSVFFRKDTVGRNASWVGYGQPLYGFANSSAMYVESSGGMYFEPLRGRHVNTPDNYVSEPTNFVGSGSNTIPIGTWHHLCYTQKTGVGNLFYDGVKVADGPMVAPAVNLKKAGCKGTLYNSIGRPFYSGDPWLTNTLLYGFSMYSKGLDQAEVPTLFSIQSTIAALDIAYASYPYELIIDLSSLLVNAKNAALSNFVPGLSALNTEIAVAQAALDAKTPTFAGNAALNAAIIKYDSLQAPLLELKALIDRADSLASFEYPGLPTFRVKIANAKIAFTMYSVTSEQVASFSLAIIAYQQSQNVYPADFTFNIVNPSFEDGIGGVLDPTSVISTGTKQYPKGWMVYLNPGGFCNSKFVSEAPSDGVACYETWGEAPIEFDVYQRVVLPVGHYKMTAQIRTSANAPHTQHIYAKTNLETFDSGTLDDSLVLRDVRWNGLDNWQTVTCNFYTSGGNTRIGFKSNAFMQFDNIKLYYYGFDKTITTEDCIGVAGKDVNLPIKTTSLSTVDSISAYQFALHYDLSSLDFLGFEKENTLSSGGTVVINNTTKGLIKVGFISEDYLNGSGTLIKFKFAAIKAGVTTPTVSNFLYNSDTVKHLYNAPVSIFTRFGDVDGNKEIQAYDAALVLQNSVGLDPIPTLDPIPWIDWRVIASDVDANNMLTANDAGLILKKSIDLITMFPAENASTVTLRSASVDNPDVTITKEGNSLVFRSYGDLIGLNVNVQGAVNCIGVPQVLNSSMMKATNILDVVYKVGLATANAPMDGIAFMVIPIVKPTNTELTFNLIINNVEKTIRANIATGLISEVGEQINIFPNPVHDFLNIDLGSWKNSTIKITNILGQLVYTSNVHKQKTEINMSTFAIPGMYYLQILNEDKRLIKSIKIIKK